MSSFLHIIVVGILSSVSDATYYGNITKSCFEKLDGFYIVSGTKCQQYYTCSRGIIANNYTCAEKHSFNILLKKCVPENEAKCLEITCSNNDEKLYTIPGTKCKMYHKCIKWNSHYFFCPEDMIFNYDLQTCVKNGYCYEPVCTGRINGEYADTTQNCERSFECIGGQINSLKNCLPHEFFSKKLKKCVNVSYIEDSCESPQKTSISFPAIKSDTQKCWNLADGGYLVPYSQCKEYYICRNGLNLGTLQCPDRYLFNGQRCAPIETVRCRDACNELKDGLHVDFYSGCKKFIFCSKGHLIWKDSCPSPLVHNGYFCVQPDQYSCPIETPLDINICTNRKNGYHRNYSHCREYFYCKDGELILTGTCPVNQVWNGETCVEKAWFFCEGPEPWFGCLVKEGLYQDFSVNSRCRNYYYCSQGNRTRYLCAPTEVFNGQKCVPKHLYKCPNLTEQNSCDYKVDGYYRDSFSCKAYYFCSNGYKNTYICPRDQVFNGEKCVNSDLYECPFSSKECLNKKDGYYYDVKQQCKQYFYCSNNERITTFYCDDNKIFDGIRCVQNNDFNCPEEESNNFCIGVSDNFYVVPNTECQNFIECKNEKVVKEMTCPKNEVFNSLNSCVSKNCIERFPNLCTKDGFFPNYDTKCKTYYFCISGKMTELQCPTGQIFNGKICVSEELFVCPENCSRYKNCNAKYH